MIRIKHLFSFFFLILTLAKLFGQESTSVLENHTYSSATSNLFKQYSQLVDKGAAIFNGAEYTAELTGIYGHQFYQFKNPQYGDVQFDGYRYDSLLISYDIYSDLLVQVYQDAGNFFMMSVSKDRVDGFYLDGHQFINVKSDPVLEDGFYDLIYEGASLVLVRRRKNTVPSTADGYLYEYKVNDRYYVRVNGRYELVGSKKRLLSLFPEKKKSIKSYVRQRRLDYKGRPDEYFNVVCSYIDQSDS